MSSGNTVNEETVRKILAKLSSFLKDVSEKDEPLVLSKPPKKKWMKIVKASFNGYHNVVLIHVGVDETESEKILDELTTLGKKYFAGEEDYIEVWDLRKQQY